MRGAGGSDLGVPPYNLRNLTCIVGGLKVMRHVSSRTQQSQAMSFGFPFHETIRVTDFLYSRSLQQCCPVGYLRCISQHYNYTTCYFYHLCDSVRFKLTFI